MKVTGRLKLSPLSTYHWLVYGKEIFFDVAEEKAELDWQPRWGNVEMFAQSYDWYVGNRERILAEKGGSPHRSAVKEGILKVLRWI
jgi:hypothetical protein